MSKSKAVFYAVLMSVVLVVLWVIRHHADKRIDSRISTVALKPTEQEKLIVNERTHTIEVISRNEKGETQTRKEFVPRHFAIVEGKSGNIEIEKRDYGTECVLSLGVLYGSDFKLRGAASLGLLYYQRWDVEVGMGVAASLSDTRAIVALTYNAYDNIQVGGYVDNRKHVGVIASMRF